LLLGAFAHMKIEGSYKTFLPTRIREEFREEGENKQ
jgi:hypothetical protein